jgi:hypothetical protein
MRSEQNSPYQHRIAEWQAEIIAGGFREASSDLGLDGLRGISTTVIDPQHKTSTPSMHVITAARGMRTPSETHMRRQIEANLSHDSRLAEARLRFIHAYGPVPIVTVRFEPPNAFDTAQDAIRPIFGDPKTYEGFLLKVVDASGKIIRLAALSNRTGAGFRIDPPR